MCSRVEQAHQRKEGASPLEKVEGGERIVQKIYWEIGGEYPQRSPWQPYQLRVAKIVKARNLNWRCCVLRDSFTAASRRHLTFHHRRPSVQREKLSWIILNMREVFNGQWQACHSVAGLPPKLATPRCILATLDADLATLVFRRWQPWQMSNKSDLLSVKSCRRPTGHEGRGQVRTR